MNLGGSLKRFLSLNNLDNCFQTGQLVAFFTDKIEFEI